jgi:hypothetical protein
MGGLHVRLSALACEYIEPVKTRGGDRIGTRAVRTCRTYARSRKISGRGGRFNGHYDVGTALAMEIYRRGEVGH